MTSSVLLNELGPNRLAFSENLSTDSFAAFGKQPAITSGRKRI